MTTDKLLELLAERMDGKKGGEVMLKYIGSPAIPGGLKFGPDAAHGVGQPNLAAQLQEAAGYEPDPEAKWCVILYEGGDYGSWARTPKMALQKAVEALEALGA